jgi:hypothetical protein
MTARDDAGKRPAHGIGWPLLLALPPLVLLVSVAGS